MSKILHIVCHKLLRKKEYPSLEEFADAYFWERNGNPEPMKLYLEKVRSVKEKIPKSPNQQK
ncbi:hypothetical protein ACO0K2_11725 [Undibacterium sp. MH2W]|uniref:hypothetical protein n=1 Tax=Undibacterium sp. MH2W TaxID=3413044 RepID=UPI003BF083EA